MYEYLYVLYLWRKMLATPDCKTIDVWRQIKQDKSSARKADGKRKKMERGKREVAGSPSYYIQ